MRIDFEKEKIKAVHDQDLEKFLENMGILKKIKRGEMKCKFCKATITLKNLHSLFPQSGDIKFVCDKADCIKKVHELINKGEVEV
ncbi:hypothetical protein KAW96_02695 [candidate division WOR-3 bacterium]|nr:hypothetical protein [candidate division WOR-3 bacterium]